MTNIIEFFISLFKVFDSLSLLIFSVFVCTLVLFFLVLVALFLPSYFLKQEKVFTIVNKIKNLESSAGLLIPRFYSALLAGIMVVFLGALTVTEWQLMDLLVEETSFILPGRSQKLKIAFELVLFIICFYFHKKCQTLADFPALQAKLLVFCHFSIFLALFKGYVFNFVDLICFSLLASLIASLIAHLKYSRQSPATGAKIIKTSTVTITRLVYLAWYYLFLMLSKMLFWFFLYHSCIYAPQQDNYDSVPVFVSAFNVEGFYLLFFMLAIIWLCVALRFLYIARSHSSTTKNILVPIPSEFFILYLWQVQPLISILSGTFKANKLKNPGLSFKVWFKNVFLTLADPVQVLFLPNSVDTFNSIVIASGKESALKIASLSVSAFVGAIGGGGLISMMQGIAWNSEAKQDLKVLIGMQSQINQIADNHPGNSVLQEHRETYNKGIDDAVNFQNLDPAVSKSAVGSSKSAASAFFRGTGYPEPVRTRQQFQNVNWEVYQQSKKQS